MPCKVRKSPGSNGPGRAHYQISKVRGAFNIFRTGSQVERKKGTQVATRSHVVAAVAAVKPRAMDSVHILFLHLKTFGGGDCIVPLED